MSIGIVDLRGPLGHNSSHGGWWRGTKTWGETVASYRGKATTKGPTRQIFLRPSPLEKADSVIFKIPPTLYLLILPPSSGPSLFSWSPNYQNSRSPESVSESASASESESESVSAPESSMYPAVALDPRAASLMG